MGGISDMIFGSKEPSIELPKAQIPAAPAPSRRQDTGAKVVVGADEKADRTSGRASGRGTGSTSRTKDILGGLGAGGLNV